MKIAYLINQYPMVSHSFIRREIRALEEMGEVIVRFALRTVEAELVDEDDKIEFGKTRYILSQSIVYILYSMLLQLVINPVGFFSGIYLTIKTGYGSDRGLLRHAAYFFEACVITRWVREEEVQHLHAHFGTNSTTIAMISKVMGGADYSFTVHGPEEFDKPRFISLDEKIRRSKFTVAITSYCRSQLYRLVAAEYWGKIKIVRCGLDDKFLAGDSTPADHEQNIFICVGRLCEQKGQLLLLEAIKRLVDSGEELKLILAGDGPMRQVIEDKIAALKLQHVVSITGWISADEVRQKIVESKMLVLASFAEGLPVVIMEAFALARPVISTYVAGIPELVNDGKNGWLVTAGSCDDLTRALQTAIAVNKADYNIMAECGKDAVLERHNVRTEAARLLRYINGEY
jgi:colanic acid/amylovoran biosynthesis glycosyltransferase